MVRMREVFVPGGQPNSTYVPRDKFHLERSLTAATDNLCKLVTITGPTKSGKSVLAKRVFPKTQSLWISGGTITSDMDFVDAIIHSYNPGFIEKEEIKTETGYGIEGSAATGFSFPILPHYELSIKPKLERRTGKSKTTGYYNNKKMSAYNSIIEHKIPIIIDDFHYINRDIQGIILRFLKEPISSGVPVIILAIPHRKYDAIKVEKEMSGRVEQIKIPAWEDEELQLIPLHGFRTLNLFCRTDIIEKFIQESMKSPLIMQEFCSQLCLMNDVVEKSNELINLKIDNIKSVFTKVANDNCRLIYEELVRGAKSRSDRKTRIFKDGTHGDIYKATLMAIADLHAGMNKITWDQIRSNLRNILIDLPQRHEVSAILERMSKMQRVSDSSCPVLDWQKESGILHITDPIFALFLKFGDAGLY